LERTLYSLTIFAIAALLTWILKLIFKLHLTGSQFVFITALIGGLLVFGLLFCPAVWHIWGPR